MLKECPFCGGKQLEYHCCHSLGEQYIECLECEIQVWYDVDLTHQEVANKWNNRLGQSPQFCREGR